jgi:filamentous hemagglutinin family protein
MAFNQAACVQLAPLVLALSFALPMMCQAAGGLPAGGHFVAGTGTISGGATSLTVDQSTPRGIIDWNSFSIGNGNRVTFNNGSGATLSRVTGGNPSVIMGALSATGSLYLINPQGIVVGPSGVVATGGRFVASTLDTDNAAFMAGADLKLTGSSKAQVLNLGRIGSTRGDVFLVAADEIDNYGTISAPQGTAELAVGQRILLHDSSTSAQVSVLVGSAGSVFNRGTIDAAQVNLQAADGNVFALSGNHEAIRATGTATRDGHVWLVADRGLVKLGGNVDAKNADGSGGAVDTNGANFAVCDCQPTVLAGLWNITAPSIEIDRAAAGTFSRSLSAGTAINVHTTGVYGRTGDIDVAANMEWTGGAALALAAYRSITVGKGVTVANSGSGNLTLRADATAIDNGGSVANNGTVDWSKSAGIVSMLYDMNGTYTPGVQLANAQWSAPQFSGLLTQITAYQLIDSLADLATLQRPAANYAGNYALGTDLKSSIGWYFPPDTLVGIGNDPTQGTHAFTGQFDGMGHSVDTAWVGAGFFDAIGPHGVVRNVNITNSLADPNDPNADAAGLLARDNQGLIANVFVSGTTSSNGYLAGGLVGHNEGTIERAGSSAYVNSYGTNGGLVGQNDGLIVQSYATGDIGPGNYGLEGGGLVGNNNGTITQSYATGNADGQPYTIAAGGLAAYNNGTITQSFATGHVSGEAALPHQSVELAGIANPDLSASATIGPDVYWNVDTSGQSYGGAGVSSANGLTTAQMSNPASFAGWRFGSGGVWAMPAGATHPVLAWQVSGH